MKTVLYIDEEEQALKILGKRLIRAYGGEVQLVKLLPLPTIPEMLQVIASHEEVVSIVVDQKLSAIGSAQYVGTELVEAIRQANSKIPLYILTNSVEDLDSNLSDVEYVLAKDDISDDEKLLKISSRLRRHINIFEDILSERDQRFEALLRKSMDTQLSSQEAKEYADLAFHREKQVLAGELLDSQELAQKLDSAEKALLEINRILGK
ncbi:hypothetical protein [Pseudoduganella sp. UC29_71]|uniref:hypothetical protein n=1 Tax=Pseudoduganella sp. UC29_71 TaxID=3350174 RepID=UPI00366B4EEB